MKRVLTAFLLVPVAVYSALFAPWAVFAGVVAVVACLCFAEYAKITGAYAPLGFGAGLALLFAPFPAALLVAFLTALAAMCVPLASPDMDKAVTRAGMLVMGVLYIFGAWKTAFLLRDVSTPHLQHLTAGRHWLMFGLMVNWLGDTGAYYVGRRYGKHKLAPLASPKKSWEGAIASAAVAMICGLIYLPLTITGTPLWIAGLFALIANVAGQFGDLAESAIKRSAGVKDSGTILPGHGGFLDRVDSTMFSLPVLWALVSFLQPA
ncbi:MAG: phosphatidate cytidylyltransferase [Acidobacteriota bacterium]|nr:phosphatidate cytidylyltransferase [Acidobacteriota bacterium]